MDKFLTTLNKFFDKMTSARFLMVVFTTIGSTALVFKIVDMLIKRQETEAAITFAMAYIGYWGIVVNSYFLKRRPSESGGSYSVTGA